MAKTRVLEITLSVMGAGEDGRPNPDFLQIANTASIGANDTDADVTSQIIDDSASRDRLVISVRISGAKKYARHCAKAGRLRPI